MHKRNIQSKKAKQLTVPTPKLILGFDHNDNLNNTDRSVVVVFIKRGEKRKVVATFINDGILRAIHKALKYIKKRYNRRQYINAIEQAISYLYTNRNRRMYSASAINEALNSFSCRKIIKHNYFGEIEHPKN